MLPFFAMICRSFKDECSCIIESIEFSKSDKMLVLLSILSLFCNKFNEFNNTGTQTLDFSYCRTLKLLLEFLFYVVKTRRFGHISGIYICDIVMTVVT